MRCKDQADRTFPLGSAFLDDSAVPWEPLRVIRHQQVSGTCHLNRHFKMFLQKPEESISNNFVVFVSERERNG